MAFERWSSNISSATDPGAQRSLLAEIGTWRTSNLTDIPGLREAAFAMSNLYAKLGERDAAVREARSLMSLCQTTPVATAEERHAAHAYLNALGEKAPPMRIIQEDRPRGRDRNERRERGDRGDRGERPARAERPDRGSRDSHDDAIERALQGDHDGALKLLKGRKGRAELVRAWVRLVKALAADDRDAELEKLDRWFRQVLPVSGGGKPAPAKAAPAPEPPPTEEDGPLGALVGRKLPKRREARVRLLARWLEENPARADELAATVLRAHLAESGAGVPAPWLVAFVAQARLGDAAQTDAALAELREAGSVAVDVYGEWAFERAVQLARSAPQRFSGLRRGVLGRGSEPDDRRAWTLRLDGEDRMLVLVPAGDAAYPAAVAAEVAARLPALCSRIVLLAPGAGNAPLREAVAGAGFVALDGEPSDNELLSALQNVQPVGEPERAPRAERAPRPERAEPRPPKEKKASAAPAPEVPAGPDPIEAFSDVLFADAVPTAEALTGPLGGLHKLRDAFLAADRRWSTFPADASARLGALLEAAHGVAPDGLSVPEGTTLALRVGAAQGGPVAEALVKGAAAERFGGPGMSDVLGVVRAAGEAGWSLRRAFRGTTRRERRGNPALAELSDSLGGVWRLGLEKDGARRELWYVAELPVEGRAGVPQLLLEERDRVVILPIDAELMAWYGTLGGPEAIGWTPEDPSSVVEALS
ncbi:MAG: hypothetical protein R3F61_17560 [Myxococcota bacterium]